VSDRSGWWNLYRFDGESHLALAPQSAEFGLPQWVFGLSTFGIDRDGTIACAFCRNGLWHLGILDGGGGKLRSCELPFTFIQQVRIRNGRVAFVGAAPETARAVFVYDLTQNRLYPCGEKSDPPLAQPFISAGQSIEVASEGGLTVQAFFYPPVNPEVTGPAGQLPPLIVMGHGGPTDANDNGLTLKIQFWTTRGFAVADVNYRGSSGRGRAFRESLNGKWGRAEVEDCLAVARHLVSEGAVDEKNLFISGSSAFGYTVLCALTFHDLFKGGASYYGISDQLALAEQTHKFEAFYSHSLIAPLPEGRESYRACSPIYHRQKLRRPIIFFQGLKDPVVAPVQAEKMVAAMRENGTPVAYLTFPEEGHGFGDEAAIRRAIEAEYSFYLQLMELPLPADLPAVLKTNSKNQRIS
nr:prolyl oligopeptidase family serine peptidase [Calditrichia bacterium]